jgi:uncharacterized protein (DUF2062 family)
MRIFCILGAYVLLWRVFSFYLGAVIGGVVFSTALTLYVVPCFYAVMSRFEKRKEHERRMANALDEQARLAKDL